MEGQILAFKADLDRMANSAARVSEYRHLTETGSLVSGLCPVGGVGTEVGFLLSRYGNVREYKRKLDLLLLLQRDLDAIRVERSTLVHLVHNGSARRQVINLRGVLERERIEHHDWRVKAATAKARRAVEFGVAVANERVLKEKALEDLAKEREAHATQRMLKARALEDLAKEKGAHAEAIEMLKDEEALKEAALKELAMEKARVARMLRVQGQLN